LAEKARSLLHNSTDVNAWPSSDRLELLYALNDLLKQRTFADAKEFEALLAAPVVAEKAGDFPEKKRKDWPDQDLRRFNRLNLENIYAGIIRTYRRRVGPDCVLSYCSRGEFIGEMGLIGQQPRTASCLAYGHPLE